jgi:hypothetical protein
MEDVVSSSDRTTMPLPEHNQITLPIVAYHARNAFIGDVVRDLAWSRFYAQTTADFPGTPYGYGCIAVKQELEFNGYDVENPAIAKIGSSASKAIKRFQEALGLEVDGVAGPRTLHALLHKRIVAAQQAAGVPDDLVCKLVRLESADDPGATGYVDPLDYGLVQIHMPFHPEISVAQAFTPAFSIPYAARTLAGFSAAHHGDWDAAVAAWNVGTAGAASWLGLHKPATGGPSWFPDLFSRATRYVALVRSQTC